MSDPAPAPDAEPVGGPADTPLLRVLEQLESEGYTGQFSVVDDGEILCHTCGGRTGATTVEADQMTRLEGASDPDDMLGVLPLVCPSCGQLGVLVVNYGPESPMEHGLFLRQLERRPSEGDDAEATPGME